MVRHGPDGYPSFSPGGIFYSYIDPLHLVQRLRSKLCQGEIPPKYLGVPNSQILEIFIDVPRICAQINNFPIKEETRLMVTLEKNLK